MRRIRTIACLASCVLAGSSTTCRSDHGDTPQAAWATPPGEARQATPNAKSVDVTRADHAKPKDLLFATASKVWAARAQRDCKTVAQYLDPKEYAAMTAQERIEVCEGDPFRYEKYRIGQVEVDEQFGWVHVAYSAKLAPFAAEPAQEIETTEKWRLQDNQWFPVAPRIDETAPESPSRRDAIQEKRLRERFEVAWKLRVAKDWKSLYDMTDPKDRRNVSELAYADSEGLIEYYEYELDWVQVIGEVGEVRVTYTNKLADPNMTKMDPRKINLSEHWILRNGEWYRDLLRTK